MAALKHLDCKGKNVVSVLSGGNMDVITMASLVQHGLINRGRIFTFSVQLPDRPGELLHVADIVAHQKGNIIKLEHNQFVNINRLSKVELRVTLRPSATSTRPPSSRPCRARDTTLSWWIPQQFTGEPPFPLLPASQTKKERRKV